MILSSGAGVPVEEYQVEKITSCERSAHIYWMKDKQIKDVQLHKTEQSILKHFDFESVQIGLDQHQWWMQCGETAALEGWRSAPSA